MKLDDSWVDEGQVQQLFQSELDIKYAAYLDRNDDVISYRYRFVPIIYFDHVTGDELIYYIGFDIEYISGREWVEAVPPSEMRPEDKYLYAHNIALSHGIIFRGLKGEEMNSMESE
ncbi:MAG: hypothetical protein GF411_02865 [Candidatus Lokiarchaeota archaeon]|nr:hypothetical protein [Candidatus Lokiarchaeota archaeon]